MKICEELSAKQKSESQQILSLQIRQVESRSGQFVKDFSHRKSVSLFFLLCRLTVTCMKRWGLRASSLSAVAKADAGQNTLNNHLPPNVLYMMLAVVFEFFCFLN